MKQSAEEKGEYSENKTSDETEQNSNGEKAATLNVKQETQQNGGLAEGFNLSKTKSEEKMDAQHKTDLVDMLRKSGVINVEVDELMNIDLNNLIQTAM